MGAQHLLGQFAIDHLLVVVTSHGADSKKAAFSAQWFDSPSSCFGVGDVLLDLNQQAIFIVVFRTNKRFKRMRAQPLRSLPLCFEPGAFTLSFVSVKAIALPAILGCGLTNHCLPVLGVAVGLAVYVGCYSA